MISQLARIFTISVSLLIIHFTINTSLVISVVPASAIFARVERLTAVHLT